MQSLWKGRFGADEIPEEFIHGLYDPFWDPEKLKLNEFISDPDERRKEVQRSLRKKIPDPAIPEPALGGRDPVAGTGSGSGVPVPLTEEEADEVDKYIEQLRSRIALVRQDIAAVRSHIDATANPEDGQELSFELNIKKRPALKRAVAIVFGLPFTTITYSMYKAAIEMKRQIEKDEAIEYMEMTE